MPPAERVGVFPAYCAVPLAARLRFGNPSLGKLADNCCRDTGGGFSKPSAPINSFSPPSIPRERGIVIPKSQPAVATRVQYKVGTSKEWKRTWKLLCHVGFRA